MPPAGPRDTRVVPRRSAAARSCCFAWFNFQNERGKRGSGLVPVCCTRLRAHACLGCGGRSGSVAAGCVLGSGALRGGPPGTVVQNRSIRSRLLQSCFPPSIARRRAACRATVARLPPQHTASRGAPPCTVRLGAPFRAEWLPLEACPSSLGLRQWVLGWTSPRKPRCGLSGAQNWAVD